eukprot:1161879-Pelagomonas_calceolata.AAC.4
MKSGSCKLLFVSSLGDANMVDFRNKLLGDYSDSLGCTCLLVGDYSDSLVGASVEGRERKGRTIAAVWSVHSGVLCGMHYGLRTKATGDSNQAKCTPRIRALQERHCKIKQGFKIRQQPGECNVVEHRVYVTLITRVYNGGLQPETLADRSLVKHAQPASELRPSLKPIDMFELRCETPKSRQERAPETPSLSTKFNL